MKKLFFLSLFVFGLAIVNVNAQADVKVSTEKAADMAAKAAAADENIVAKVCQHSGTTSYYQKSIEESGSVKMTKVIFDANSGSFIAAAKAGGKSCAGDKGGAKSCAGDKGAKKACCKGGEKKSCSGDKGAKKACCKGGKKKGCSKTK